MAIEQNVLRSCVALKLITNGLDMAHDMREQRRGATGPHDDDARANSCTDDGTPAPAHDDDTCTDDDTPSRRMAMIRHMKMMHMRIHAQTMVHLHPRMTMTQAQTMIHPGRRMTMIHAQMQAQTMPLAPLVSMRRAQWSDNTRNVHPTEIADEPLADLRGRELSERESV